MEQDSILLINKDKGWSSFDVVKRVRSGLKLKKVGHAGTLDPLASGLLILCTGKYTKKITSIQDLEKEYTGIITLGAVTESYDLETSVINPMPIEHITLDEIKSATKKFTGEIFQLPPVFSAVKIDGERAYKLARKGERPDVTPRLVQVHEFEITDYSMPDVEFRVRCSKGTYIRSLANDLGQELGCGGYLKELCRTRIGDYKLSDAHAIEELIREKSHSSGS